MQFVIEAWKKQRSRVRLQNLILLIIRCLIPLVLGFALSQPILDTMELIGNSKKINYLIIDNSLVSKHRDSNGVSLFERHVESARKIILDSNDNEVFQIIPTVHFDSKLNMATRDRGTLEAQLDGLQSSYQNADLNALFRSLGSTTQDEATGIKTVYFISDFRKGTTTNNENLPRNAFSSSHTRLNYMKPSSKSMNIVRVIDANPARRRTLRGGGIESLFSQCVLRLERDGSQLGSEVTEITAKNSQGDSTSKMVEWEDGQREMYADIVLPATMDQIDTTPITISTGPGPTQKFFLTVEVDDYLRTIILDRSNTGYVEGGINQDPGSWMERAIRPTKDIPIDVRFIDPVSLTKTDLIDTDAVFVLRPDLLEKQSWDELSGFLGQGGMVFITPPVNKEVHDWIDSMNNAFNLEWDHRIDVVKHEADRKIDYVDTSESILDVIRSEIPLLAEAVRVRKLVDIDPGLNSTVILQDDSGLPLFVTDTSSGSGTLVFLSTAVDLEWSSLPAKPLIVPLIQESLRGGIQSGRLGKSIIVGDQEWRSSMKGYSGDLVHSDGSFIPLDAPDSQINKPGFWKINANLRDNPEFIVSNVDSSSGDVDVQSLETIDNWLASSGEWTVFSGEIQDQKSNTNLTWLLLMALAVLFLLETLLARLFTPADSQFVTENTIPGMS